MPRVRILNILYYNLEDNKVTVMTFINFSNAFNTICHDVLLAILSYLIISSEALKWFSSYLLGRQQCVHIDDMSSNWRDHHTGVPQGGILSPLLFSIFIDLDTRHLQCTYYLYADDLQVYTRSKVKDIYPYTRHRQGY